jgi:hypothetical protein
MHHVATLGVPSPRDPRDRVQSGRFLRALLLRWLGVTVVLWALIASVTGLLGWWLILGAVATGGLAGDVLWLSYRVRRDEQRRAEDRS